MDDTPWLDRRELAAWVKVAALLELLPGVLDRQLRRDSDLILFEYLVLAMLSEAPDRTLRMTDLAAQTNATLPRLSHVVRRLEERALVERVPCPDNKRSVNARLTEEGWERVRGAAPGHVEVVRAHVLDALTPEQVQQLTTIADAVLSRVDAAGAMAPMYRRYDDAEADLRREG